MIKARVRAGASWDDALILNMSSKGLLVRSSRSVNRGSYLEIRRGPHVIVARVIWSGPDRFGVQTQDPVPAADLIRDCDGAAPRPKATVAVAPDRRFTPRSTDERHESSRRGGRAMEFVAAAFVCGMFAVLVANAVADALASPLRAAEAALASK